MTEVLMTLGSFRFSIGTAPYSRLRRTAGYRWEKQDRAGRRPARQFVGVGDESVVLSGAMYPGYTGGPAEVEKLREQAGGGVPYILSDGRGNVWGKFCISQVSETGGVFFADGTPRKIEFEIKLVRYGDDV